MNFFDRFLVNILARRLTSEPEYPMTHRIPFNPRSLAGPTITPDTAVTVSAVWACLRYLSQTVAVLPWNVMKFNTATGRKLAAPTHPNDWLLSRRPNPEWSSFQFRETLTHWALRWGNGYAEIERDNLGRPLALWPLHPDRVIPNRDQDSGKLIYKIYNGLDNTTILDAADVFHIRGFGEGPIGVNVVEYAAESLGWAKAVQLFGAAFFGNGMNMGGFIQQKTGLKASGLKLLEDKLNQRFKGPRNSNRWAVLDAGMEPKPIGIEPDKAQFIETNKHLVDEVCFVPGTEIITPHGLRPIEQITVGEVVLTHCGRWRKVTNVMSRSYVGPAVTVGAKGLSPVTATSNHPFYVQPVKPSRTHRIDAYGSAEFVAAGNLIPARRQNDGRRARGAFHALTMPKLAHDLTIKELDMVEWAPQGAICDALTVRSSKNGRATPISRHPEVGYDLGWLVGLFAADGSSTDHQVAFYIGEHEKEITVALVERLARVFAAACSTATSGSVDRTVVSHRVLAAFFADCGHNAHEKHLPGWCMAGGIEFKRGVIDGLVAGDGCVYGRRSMLRTTSVSLAWQVRSLLWADSINSTLQIAAEGVWEINGRSGASREIATVEWATDSMRRGTMGSTEGHVYFQLDRADHTTYSGTVYNLEVEEDESYTTVGGIVHNCRWFGVPPHKVMHLDRATFSNIEHQAIEVVVDSVHPWVKRFEDEADFKLFGQNRLNFYTKMNMRALLRGDFKSQQEGFEVMRRNAALNADEWRTLVDMDPIGAEDGGDKYILQSNNTTLEKIGEDAVDAAGNPIPDPADSEESTSDPGDPTNPDQPDPDESAAQDRLIWMADTLVSKHV